VEVVVAADPAGVARIGGEIVAGWLGPAPRGTLLAALGTSPLGVYDDLAARRVDGRLDTSRLRLVQLDEYLDVGDDDPRSLYGWLRRAVALPLGIPDERIVRMRGDDGDPDRAAAAWDAEVAAAGGIGVAVLGLGPNGHLGFNEPPSAADAPTRVVALADASLESNSRYWDATLPVPRRALTAGMRALLAARRTLLVVTGEHKREILGRTLDGAIDPWVPASLLRTAEAVTLVADAAALPGARSRRTVVA
jgi:glucosamine-6-phosphate deaminase